MRLIEVTKVTKTYRLDQVEEQALRGVNFAVNKGDFICIAGPSGSGKTTLLNLIGALDNPTSGNISFDGLDITGFSLSALSDLRLKKIGFVFQAYNLFPSLTVLENTEYVMLLQGIAQQERLKVCKELLETVGLSDYFNKMPYQLSGGQQQRVAVVRAIAAQPQVILADEPTANLDSKNAAMLLDLMRQLNQSKQITFVFSTHDKLVMDRADRVHYLKDGVFING